MFDLSTMTLLFAVLLMAPAVYISVLWAPIGGVIVGMLAHSRGMNGFKYGLIGALYSAAFFCPWIYFTASVNGKWVESGFVRAAYISLFIAWLASTMGHATLRFIAWIGKLFGGAVSFAWEVGPLIDLASISIWCCSLAWLVWTNETLGPARENSDGVEIISMGYLQPFVLCAVSTISYPFLMGLVSNDSQYYLAVL